MLYTLTGVPYFQVADKMDYIKVVARENDIIDLVMAKNVTMEPLRTDEKVEGTLKFSPIGVWEGSGQEVEVQISEEEESAKNTLVGASFILASMLFAMA